MTAPQAYQFPPELEAAARAHHSRTHGDAEYLQLLDAIKEFEANARTAIERLQADLAEYRARVETWRVEAAAHREEHAARRSEDG